VSLFDSLKPDDFAHVQTYLQTMHFPKDTRIVKQGSPGHGCYLVDKGKVRLEIDTAETDSNFVLGYLDPGMLLGEFSLIEEKPRSASAYADTDVVARWLATADFRTICDQHPKAGTVILTNLARELTQKIQIMNERVAGSISSEKTPNEVDDVVARAVAAQRAFEDWPEPQVDILLRDIAESIAEQAESLAVATVEETGYGVVAHKVAKIRFASLDVYKMLSGRSGSGIFKTDEPTKITEIASAMGVVLGLIPVTNPVPTMVFKALICLKARNALIMSPHNKAVKLSSQALEIIQDALCRHGAPVDLIQSIPAPTSRRKTSLFMLHKDVSFILATGGPSMVRAAYSSGTPAIGVGAGNAPAWICADADVEKVAKIVVDSKSFDNGVICGSENNLVVDASVRESFMEALLAQDATVLDSDEIERFSAFVFDAKTGHLKRDVVGKSAEVILHGAGIHREDRVRLVVVPVDQDKVCGPYGLEKLAPILSLFTVKGEAEGLALCKQILANQGSGHTAIVHTNNLDLATRFGLEMPVSRTLVNCPGSQGCIGLASGLTPSLTLGCGTYGGSSSTDNISYINLLNIKRIAHAL